MEALTSRLPALSHLNFTWRDALDIAIVALPDGGTFDDRAQSEAAADALLRAARGYGHNDFKIVLARRTLIACLRDLTA